MLDNLEKNMEKLGNIASFAEPGQDAIARLAAIPLLFDTPADTSREEGKISFDSWSHLSAVTIRDTSAGHIRLLKLKSRKITIELVAEKQHDGWEFVARIYKNKKIIHDFVLIANGKKHLASSGGFIHWSSKSVPKQINLLSFKSKLVFEGLKWS
jgi:hypothetical protein